MKPEIGNKYIIEIDRAYASKKHAESRYGIKGFENFVLSKRNIRDALKYGNIEPLADHDADAYQRGLNDAWDAALFALHGIDRNVEAMLDEISLFGAIDALKEYEQKKAEDETIRLGDEVEVWDTNTWVKFIACGELGDGTIEGFDMDGGIFSYPKSICRKTGKRFVVTESEGEDE